MSVPKTYNSVVAAKYLLAIGNGKGYNLNTTKVQKILFIAYGYYLAKLNVVLLDETPAAWPYGPVFPNVRRKIDYTIQVKMENPELIEIKQDDIVTGLFVFVIDSFAKYSASQLSAWSHMENTPWDRTTKLPNFNWDDPIPLKFIKEYFSSVLGINSEQPANG